MTNSYISLYIHIVFNRPDGTFVLSYLHPAMNRRAIVTDATNTGHQNRFKLALMTRWGEGEGEGDRRVELSATILRNAEDSVKEKQMLKRSSGRYCGIVN